MLSENTTVSSISSEFAVLTPDISRPLSTVNNKGTLIARWKAVEVHIDLPVSRLQFGSKLWDNFVSGLGSTKPEDDIFTEEELFAEFLSFCMDHVSEQDPSENSQASLSIVGSLLESFEQDHLGGNDIHSALRHLEIPLKRKLLIIKVYFAAQRMLDRTPDHLPSNLLQAAEKGSARIYVLFGGQGNDEKYFDDLKETYFTYPAILRILINSAARLFEGLSAKSEFKNHFPKGFSLLDWLHTPESEPDSAYILAAPISMPLIGLLQICHVLVACRTMGLTPRELCNSLAGVTGHSQGIVVALILAISNTWEDFHRNSQDALRILFYTACRSHELHPPQFVPEFIRQDAQDNNEGTPSPMLRVRNLRRENLQQNIDKVNEHLPTSSHVSISLFNSPMNLVVTGPPMSLHGLNLHLRTLKAATSNREARIPASQRKPNIDNRFLSVTAPFHSVYLEDVAGLVLQDLQGLHIYASQLQTPLFATTDGQDMRKHNNQNIIPEIVRMVTENPVHWEKATAFPGATHVIDFGPGGSAGLGSVTVHNKAGLGVRLILGGSMKDSEEYGNKAEAFDRDPRHPVLYAENWAEEYKPRLTTDASNKVQIKTKFTELFGLPPIMVAGMTPTTVAWDFVSAAMNAGYHIELAGGGYYNADALQDAIDSLIRNVTPGRGVTCNIIYANPNSVRWQIPLIKDLRLKGLPIDGITIGAGIPSLDVANEYIQTLGIRHISFKPGSMESIQQVIEIARENRSFPIIMQWTGGRGGGHHSYEDFHDPILQMYGRIRACKNIILLAGSGFGGAEDTLPYLTGEWTKAYNISSPMPFDGILIGSRVMVAREAHTSIEAKMLIADTPGVEDSSWEQTYSRPTGGILTVRSEMGEPIHKIATRGVRLWAEMDRTVFSITDKASRVAYLRENKQRIIDSLNNDFQKVWFGRDHHGQACDLEQMTLAEVVLRMVELLYIHHESRWIHHSLQKLTYDFLQWIEDFVSPPEDVSKPRFWQSVAQIDKPHSTIEQFLSGSPATMLQLMDTTSIQMFIFLCKRSGQKPVPFIPILDEDFEVWFKKDSLWQSEDVQAVPEQDVDRICILHGPVAARHSKLANEPVKQILDNIHRQWVSSLVNRGYDINAVQTPSTDFKETESLSNYASTEISTDKIYDPAIYIGDPHAVDDWMTLLGGTKSGWRRAMFTQKTIVQGHSICENPLRRLFSPRSGVSVEVDDSTGADQCIVRLYETTINDTSQKLAVEVRAVDQDLIAVTLLEGRTINGIPAKLELLFSYHPDVSFAPIREVLPGKIDRINGFYCQLWFGQPSGSFDNLARYDEFHGETVIVTSENIKHFSQCIGNVSESAIRRSRSQRLCAPMDYAIVVAWKSVMKPLLTKSINGNLLKLVHLSNQFKLLEGSEPIHEGDVLNSSARIRAVLNEDSGKVVEVVSQIRRDGDTKAIMEVVSRFMYRGNYNDYASTFQHSKEPKIEIQLISAKDVAILQAKTWFIPKSSDLDLQGFRLTFHLETHAEYRDKSVFERLRCFGPIYGRTATGETLEVGHVDHKAGISYCNPVTDYLKRHGTLMDQPTIFERPIILGNGELRFNSPLSNEEYAKVSGDFNPIHVSPTFAAYAELPGTITHGMHMSAKVRGLLEQITVAGTPNRFRNYKCSFVGMVLPEDDVEVVYQHFGMVNGRKLIRAEAFRTGSLEKLIVAEAEIEQPSTTYLFTGQGSQEKGMGMDLYASSSAARKVWDRADKHFFDNYGFRITDIVRNDPKELTIHFGGIRGRAIRENYMALQCEMIHPDGRVTSEKMFKEINADSRSYTFRSALGLLSSTQFTQPALTLMEKAIIDDMKEKGLVTENCSFAGHSLGEYSALAAIAEIMPIESLVSVVFHRGLTMQMAVERDSHGRSNFSMCAVDPGRLSKTFDEERLGYLVALISSETGWLLEIVNYNVSNSQYVCAGDLRALDCLSEVIGVFKTQEKEFQDVLSGHRPLEEIRARMLTTIRSCASEVKAKPQPIQLQRGVATVPLRGIDVPFHSSFLAPGISTFRECLHRHIDKYTLNTDKLVGKYIPNLTATPFEINEDYFQEVYRLTKSPVIGKILSEWNGYANADRGPEKLSISVTVSH